MKLAWITDPHLDHVSAEDFERFLDVLDGAEVEGFLIGGDIAESSTVIRVLERLDDRLKRPLYFVLGNHDYYRGSIARTRAAAAALSLRRPRCLYLPSSGVCPIGKDTALIGHGGWGDGRCGDFMASPVMLNDYILIEELVTGDKAVRLERLKALGDEAAESLREGLVSALAGFERVVLLTHVPPLLEACWHEGQISNSAWTPHFTCLAVGEVLLEIMAAHPRQHLEVLCGHTHSGGVAHPLPNMVVRTGGAVYGAPAIAATFQWP